MRGSAYRLTAMEGGSRNSRRMTSAGPHAPTADVRRAVLADRRALLAAVPTYSAVEIGAACDGGNSNLSQRAAELRISQRLFGLRSGWKWRYPQFQFDAELKVFPEMRHILLNLPD